jgi:hypothetical protein
MITKKFCEYACTLVVTTFSLTTLIIMDLIVTLRIISIECLYAGCHYTECHTEYHSAERWREHYKSELIEDFNQLK